MRLTTKGRFAVTAMVDLAVNSGNGPVTLASISERQKISLSYLEQLFGKLRKHDVVASVRGPGGGYCLSRPAHKISISDIIVAVDESADMLVHLRGQAAAAGLGNVDIVAARGMQGDDAQVRRELQCDRVDTEHAAHDHGARLGKISAVSGIQIAPGSEGRHVGYAVSRTIKDFDRRRQFAEAVRYDDDAAGILSAHAADTTRLSADERAATRSRGHSPAETANVSQDSSATVGRSWASTVTARTGAART